MGERAFLSERRYRAHHDARIQSRNGWIIEAHPADHARREILDDDVDLRDQIAKNRQRFRSFYIETDSELAAILLNVITAAAVFQVRQFARAIAVRRDFDFNDLRAHLRHHPGRRRSGDVLREVENFVGLENMRGSSHRYLSK